MRFSRVVRRGIRFFLPALLALLPLAAELRAQQHPAEITLAQSTALPYRLTGRLNVTFGDTSYFGTSTYIRRYTGVTAGHLLYDPKSGLGTNLFYEPALYILARTEIPVSYFAVLDGYQAAAGVDPDSNGAFAYDMGYVLFSRPAPNAEWADFGDNTGTLTTDSKFLVFGYAAENFKGDEQAFVNIAAPFYQLRAPALYENSSYYTEEGMSGGPLYPLNVSVMQVSAVTVAGTSVPDAPLSDVRAITGTEVTLFTEAEYVHGLIKSGLIKGPATVAAGGVGKYKTGVVFADGVQEGRDLTPRYDELTLVPVGAHKRLVSVTKLKTSKFKLKFSSGLASGTTITLDLLRTTAAKSAQTPLQTFVVTVQ